jgi:putative transposase
MGRPHRIFSPGITEHLIQRGTNRMTVFEDDADFVWFLCRLKHVARVNGVSVHGFTLMTNHVHIMATPTSESAVPAMMGGLFSGYAKYFNRRYDRIGALWNGRYRPKMIGDESYWLTCLRYVEQNPVRANIVLTPGDYRWSSYAAHAWGRWPDWLVPHPVYLALGSTPADRQQKYREICGEPVNSEQLGMIRCTVPIGSSPSADELVVVAQ